jgi:23S rRNA pseudouridine2605 synthase
MAKSAFDKFMSKEPKGAAKKEMFRQEKRKAKEERRATGEAFRKKQWEKKHGIVSDDSKPNKRFEVKKAKPDYGTANPAEKKKPTIAPKRFDKDGNETRPVEKTKAITSAKGFVKNEAAGKPLAANQTSPSAKNDANQQMPLNKFVAYAGVCGRREAAELIKQGLVTVNNDRILEPGYKVYGNEDIKVKGKRVFAQRNLVYILVNKPKDYITTAKDPEGRKTILDLVKGATTERIYPVGRLDRNTTGVLLLTNDGELAQKLTHPSFEIKKIYEVKLDRPVVKKDMEAIANGINLEDGFVQADAIAYVDANDKSTVGIEIHSGRNRIVRRIFEHLGYDVKGLDRVMFANLTKKNVDRGRWRMLTEKEVRLLKYMNQSFIKKGKKDATHHKNMQELGD